MQKEIKVVPLSIERELHKLSIAQKDFATRFDLMTEGNNQLDLVSDLMGIKESYTRMSEDYLALLEQHTQLTRESVETVQQTDYELSQGIQMLKN